MTISRKTWNKYISDLRKINDAAAKRVIDFMKDYPDLNNSVARKEIIEFSYAIAEEYGTASAAISAEMYDAIAALQKVNVPAAIPAETATYSDVAKTVNGILKTSTNPELVGQGIGRLVKLTGTDTILSNAARDSETPPMMAPRYRASRRAVKMRNNGAQVAWIPSGDTCPYCIMLAGAGWRKQTNWGAQQHTEHVHANCDCTYMVRFNNDLDVAGYDPNEYEEMYKSVDGGNMEERLNAMRREAYSENKEKINEQKRSAYAKRKERESSEAEEIDVG